MIPCSKCFRLKFKLRMATFAETAEETQLNFVISGSTYESAKQEIRRAMANENYRLALLPWSEHQATHR
jgi:hypothetical protein